MTTVLSARRLGKLIGTCDARCYDAKTPGCDCICGGRCHGKGLRAAIRIALTRLGNIQHELNPTDPRTPHTSVYIHHWPSPQTTDTSSDSPKPEISAPSPSTDPERTAPSGS